MKTGHFRAQGLGVAILSVGLAVSVSATDYTWVGPNNGYWTNAANWDLNSGYPGAADKAIFSSNAVTPVTVKIDTALPVNGVIFTNLPPSGTQHSYVLGTVGSGSLIVGSGGIGKFPGAWDQTVNCDVSLSADATIVHNNSGYDGNNQRTLTFNGAVDAGTHALTVSALTRDTYLKGKVSGSGSFQYLGAGGTLHLQSGLNDFTGAVTADGGGNGGSFLYLDGAGVANAAAGFSVVNRAQFVVGSTGSTSNRIGDSTPVSLARYASRLKLVGQNSAATTESFGTLSMDGEVVVVEVGKGSGAGTATLQPATLTRNAVRRPVMLVYGTAYALGSGENVTLADGGASLAQIGGDGSRTTNKKIVPYLFTRTEATGAINGYSLTGGGSSFVGYDPANGLTQLNPATDFVNATNSDFPAVDADGNDNVRMPFTICKPGLGSNAVGSVVADAAVNSILFYNDASAANQGNYTLGGVGRTLTVKSGLIMGGLSSAADRFQSLYLSVGTIDFASAEGVILLMGPHYGSFYLSSNLRGTNGLTAYLDFSQGAAGEGSLYLSGDNSALTGQVTIINNTIVAQSLNALGNGGNVLTLARGTLKPNVAIGSGKALSVAAVTGYGTVMDGGNPFNIGATNGVASRYRLLANGLIAPGDAAQAGTLTLKTPSGYQHAWSNGVVAVDLFATNSYDVVKLDSSGTAALTITNTELDVALNFAPTVGSSFPVIQVTGATPVSGKFSNGDTVKVQYGIVKYVFNILYNDASNGGDGNDIVLQLAQIIRPTGSLILIH